ncbi:Rho GTPase activation protein, partial [Baffinella frigidus]
MEIDPTLMTEQDNLQSNVKDLVFFCGCLLDEIRQKVSAGLGNNITAIFMQLRTLSEARFPNSGLGVVAGLLIHRFLAPAIVEPHLFGLTDIAPDPTLERALKLVATVLKALASNEEFPRDSPMSAMNTFISTNHRVMQQLLKTASSGKDDSWDHSDPKKVEVLPKDVPDLLRLVVNKMEIIERHAYLQEQQHE